MVTSEFLVQGGCTVMFFANNSAIASTECGCSHDHVGERGRAPGNGYSSIRARTLGKHHLLGTTPV